MITFVGTQGKGSPPVERAERLITKQFGDDLKWQRTNDAIWHFFKQHENESLGLSEIAAIASEIDVSVEDVLSVLSLLTGPSKEFTRCVFYRRESNGIRENISAKEVIAETRRWWVEHKITEDQWQNWASKILVGWEPAQ